MNDDIGTMKRLAAIDDRLVLCRKTKQDTQRLIDFLENQRAQLIAGRPAPDLAKEELTAMLLRVQNLLRRWL